MNMRYIVASLLFLLLFAVQIVATEPIVTLSLDSCRALAIANNKELRIAGNKRQAAFYERKAAATKYLPRINATGSYMHSSRDISLLSGGQKENLGHLGQILSNAVPSLQDASGVLDALGGKLASAAQTDTRNMGVVGILMTQPVYMGGRIVAYNRISQYAEQIAEKQHDLTLQNIIVDVDEAYWQIVSLQSKKKLAESYLDLVCRLDSDVTKMIDEGFATKADGLSVKVKVNEAKVALIQVDNGLSLSRMLLCQICGLEINTPIVLVDEDSQAAKSDPTPIRAEVNDALALRPELNMLSLSADIYKEKVRLVRSEFLPTVALTAGGLASNPSMFNGFERKMRGMWNIGVTVSVPLVTFGERCYKIKAAQAEAQAARTEIEENREKVILQVNQNRQKVQEAAERLQTAHRSCDEADENLRYATLGLQEGVMPVSNVLEAQTAWLKSHSEYVSSKIDLQLANLYLLKSVGTLSTNYK